MFLIVILSVFFSGFYLLEKDGKQKALPGSFLSTCIFLSYLQKNFFFCCFFFCLMYGAVKKQMGKVFSGWFFLDLYEILFWIFPEIDSQVKNYRYIFSFTQKYWTFHFFMCKTEWKFFRRIYLEVKKQIKQFLECFFFKILYKFYIIKYLWRPERKWDFFVPMICCFLILDCFLFCVFDSRTGEKQKG